MEVAHIAPLVSDLIEITFEQKLKDGLSGAEPIQLPAGFPLKVADAMAWKGSDFAAESDYILQLTDADIAELETALAGFKATGLDGDMVSKETFVLPTLGSKLHGVAEDVHDGRGFAVVRGLDSTKYAVEDLTILYLGVQSYVAEERGRQDSRGNMLVHIIADNKTKLGESHHRHSNKSITFHNEEAGDVVSWLTRGAAAAGGSCIISSGHTVYNVLASSRPDVIRTLARSDWPFAIPRFTCRPVLFYRHGRLMINFGRAPLLGNEAHPRPATLPALSKRQVEALDLVEAIAHATELEISTRSGDIHFINNLAIMHRRESFVDGPAGVPSAARRHLVRMRLRSPTLGWEIPEELAREWYEAFDKEDADRVWHVESMPEGFFPLRKYPN